jgi:hypothetical protein
LYVPGGPIVFVDGYKGLAVAGSCLVGTCIALAIMLRLMQSTRESYGTVLFLVIAPPTLYLGSLMLLQTKAG